MTVHSRSLGSVGKREDVVQKKRDGVGSTSCNRQTSWCQVQRDYAPSDSRDKLWTGSWGVYS